MPPDSLLLFLFSLRSSALAAFLAFFSVIVWWQEMCIIKSSCTYALPGPWKRWSGRGVLSFLLLNESLPFFCCSFINLNNFCWVPVLGHALYWATVGTGYPGWFSEVCQLGLQVARLGILFSLQIDLHPSPPVLEGWPHTSQVPLLSDSWLDSASGPRGRAQRQRDVWAWGFGLFWSAFTTPTPRKPQLFLNCLSLTSPLLTIWASLPSGV